MHEYKIPRLSTAPLILIAVLLLGGALGFVYSMMTDKGSDYLDPMAGLIGAVIGAIALLAYLQERYLTKIQQKVATQSEHQAHADRYRYAATGIIDDFLQFVSKMDNSRSLFITAAEQKNRLSELDGFLSRFQQEAHHSVAALIDSTSTQEAALTQEKAETLTKALQRITSRVRSLASTACHTQPTEIDEGKLASFYNALICVRNSPKWPGSPKPYHNRHWWYMGELDNDLKSLSSEKKSSLLYENEELRHQLSNLEPGLRSAAATAEDFLRANQALLPWLRLFKSALEWTANWQQISTNHEGHIYFLNPRLITVSLKHARSALNDSVHGFTREIAALDAALDELSALPVKETFDGDEMKKLLKASKNARDALFQSAAAQSKASKDIKLGAIHFIDEDTAFLAGCLELVDDLCSTGIPIAIYAPDFIARHVNERHTIKDLWDQEGTRAEGTIQALISEFQAAKGAIEMIGLYRSYARIQ